MYPWCDIYAIYVHTVIPKEAQHMVPSAITISAEIPRWYCKSLDALSQRFVRDLD